MSIRIRYRDKWPDEPDVIKIPGIIAPRETDSTLYGWEIRIPHLIRVNLIVVRSERSVTP